MSEIYFELANISKNRSLNFRGFTVKVNRKCGRGIKGIICEAFYLPDILFVSTAKPDRHIWIMSLVSSSVSSHFMFPINNF